jgi:hypothetical protein
MCSTAVCQIITLLCFVLQREVMMASPPCYCLSAADDDPNNFIVRTIKLYGLAGRHEKNVNDVILGRMRALMMNPLHFHCQSTAVHSIAECHNLIMTEMLFS